MLDPGTILAVTGLTLQCLDILLKTVSKIEESSRTIAERQERLYEWSAQLSFCNMQIESWFNVWGGFDESEYRSFWGDGAYQSIKQWLSQIRLNVTDIEKYVRGLDPVAENSQSPTLLEWQNWRDLDVKEFKKELKRAQVNKHKIKFVSKIAFSLVHDPRLRERFQRLDQSLQRLNNVSRIKFRSFRVEDESKPVERKELSKIKYAERNLTVITSLAKALFEARSDDGECDEQWHIELRKPDPFGDAQKIDLMAELHLDLSIQTFQRNVWKHGMRIRVLCTHRSSQTADVTVKSVLDELAKAETGKISYATYIKKGSKVHRLPPPSQLSLPLRALTVNGILSREETLQAWSGDQAGLLRGYAHWILLLWNTEWTQKLCCCCIRFQNILGHGRQYTLASAYHNDCLSRHLPSRRLVSFGVTVAEIVSATPLRVCWSTKNHPQTEASYALECWDLEASIWQTTTREEVIQLVWLKSSEGVADAVAHCLDPDLLVDDSSSGFLSFYHRNILTPLDEYCQMVLEHRQQFQSTSWWKTFIKAIFGCDWPPIAALEQQPVELADAQMPGAY